MRYQVITGLTPCEVAEHAIGHFGPHGAGLRLTSQTSQSLMFQGRGGHVAITITPGIQTILELETQEWDEAGQQFMAQVSRRRWLARWWRRRKPAMSLPLIFNKLPAAGESSEQRYAQREPE
jgi:hypothetical protein